MTDIYQTPAASLEDSANTQEQFGSVEQGLRGDYAFSIGAIISEAWEKVKGSKGTFALGGLIYFGFLILVSLPFEISAVFARTAVEDNNILVLIAFVKQIAVTLVTTPIMVGLIMLGMRRSANVPIRASSVLNYFGSMGSLFVTMLLMYIMLIIGFLLLIIPGIYLSVAYYMAMPLVVEKGMGPWQALETSRKVVSKHWFKMFFFGIVMMLIMLISMLPLGIGLIWTLPLMMIAYGIIYRNMFGLRKETLAE